MKKFALPEDDDLASLSDAQNQDLDIPLSVAVSVEDLLDGFPIVMNFPILRSDEDEFKHVNNLVYLQWCERARVEYLRRISLWTGLPPSGTGPILASVKCDYKTPLRFPDIACVGTRVSRIGNSSMRMEHIIVSQELRIVAAVIDSTIVTIDHTRGNSITVPANVRGLIGELEGKFFDMPDA
ncbi:MAG: acyl-CoA thioesterase [Acidobacteria bacterium]|nr:MAG: acyl-CoA thioesterase [Acidobacteriota bacterium]